MPREGSPRRDRRAEAQRRDRALAKPRRSLAAGSLALIASLLLSACGERGPDDAGAEGDPAAADPAPSAAAGDGSGLTVSGQWVEAAESGDSEAFGVVANASDREVTIVAASSTAAESVELHESSRSEAGTPSMAAVEGGFTLRPGEELVLQPGGDHLMLRGLTCSLRAGGEVDVALRTEDGLVLSVPLPVRDYTEDEIDDSSPGEPDGISIESLGEPAPAGSAEGAGVDDAGFGARGGSTGDDALDPCSR